MCSSNSDDLSSGKKQKFFLTIISQKNFNSLVGAHKQERLRGGAYTWVCWWMFAHVCVRKCSCVGGVSKCGQITTYEIVGWVDDESDFDE